MSVYSESQRDLSKHKMLLESKAKRIKDLETILKDTKEAAAREYRKLQEEKEQMRNGFLAKLKDRESIIFIII